MAETPTSSPFHSHVVSKPQLPVSLINTRHVTVSRIFLCRISLPMVVTDIAGESEISDLVTGQHA